MNIIVPPTEVAVATPTPARYVRLHKNNLYTLREIRATFVNNERTCRERGIVCYAKGDPVDWAQVLNAFDVALMHEGIIL